MSDDSDYRNQSPSARGGMYVLGMGIFIVSLSILFAALIVGYVVVRYNSPQWRPANTPALPWGLWISTGLLLACSVLVQRALIMIRRDEGDKTKRALFLALVLGIAFLLNQTVNWTEMVMQNLSMYKGFFGFMFYALTGLHALHVLGGIGQLWVVARRAARNAYSADEHTGVTVSVMYWHFLDAVWLVIFLCLVGIS